MHRNGFARFAGVSLLFVALIGCSDEYDPNAPAAPASPAAVLLNGGNGHFDFLAPLGGRGGDGVFNPRLAPMVEVCRLATTSQPEVATPCEELVARFTTDGGDPAERIEVDVRREMYSVNWDLSRYTLPEAYYRVTVRTAPSTGANTLLGIADVAIAANKSIANRMAGAGVHALTSTETLPIKFRIEEGALCAAGVDCFEGSVGPAGGTFVTGAEHAGVEFPTGALADTRTLVIERVGPNEAPWCVPTHHPQYEGCYRYRLEPALEPGETFATEVVVGVCLDPAALAFEDEMEIQKWDEVDPASLESLPRREIEFLECDDFAVSAPAGGSFLSTVARRGARLLAPVAGFFAPGVAYAGKSPFGGGLNDFSRMGWVRPLAFATTPEDAPAGPLASGSDACVGETIQPSVGIGSLITGLPLSGVPVSFTVTAGGGSVSPATGTTNSDGVVSTAWTLGVGSNSLLVRGLNPLSGWPQWTEVPPVWGSTTLQTTARAAYTATFFSPFGSAISGSPDYAPGLAPMLEFCEIDAAGECVGESIGYGPFTEYADLMLYKLNWTAPTMQDGRLYRIAVVLDGRVAGSVTITADKSLKTGDVRYIASGTSLSIKIDLVRASACTD